MNNISGENHCEEPSSPTSPSVSYRMVPHMDNHHYTPHLRFRHGRPTPKIDLGPLRHLTLSSGPASPTKNDVIRLNFHQEENQVAHHTDRYMPAVSELVIRRGQSFKLDICHRNINFERGTDRLKLLFASCEEAQESKGTLANVTVHSGEKACPKNVNIWRAYIISVNDDSIQVCVTSSADAIVSAYKIIVKIFVQDEDGNEKRYMTSVDKKLYLLFNPWCKDDQVYLEDEEERDEYVLNDTGRIFLGSKNQIITRPWIFGQFENCCFEAAMLVLNNSNSDKRAHSNATMVCRALTSMANNCEGDHGILTGNWEGKYQGGTMPTAWNGSVAILEQYMHSGRPVHFGQCWVFSGVLTTLCRSLGIPTRSVTNFDSAHDSAASLTVDQFFSYTGDPIETPCKDTVWSFHVWNEGWFRRPDLPRGHDGWQAFDATPQEASDSMLRCGPAPVSAIKQGLVYLSYDTRLIFSEIYADKVTWLVKPDGDMVPLKNFTEKLGTGKCVSTKAVGCSERQDITENYKFPDGSRQLKESLERAYSFGVKRTDLERLYEQGIGDVSFKYKSKCAKNGDIEVTLEASNISSMTRTSTIKIRSASMYYTGVVCKQLTTSDEVIALDPGGEKSIGWTLAAEDYLNLLGEDAQLKVYVTAVIKETAQFFAKTETHSIKKPDLILEVSQGSVQVGDEVQVNMRLTNPVPVKLTQGVIHLEGLGLQRYHKIHLHRGIEPGQEILQSTKIKPQHPGNHELVACFNSRQLTGITGVITINVHC